MAFDVYSLTDLQIELGYFASAVGQSFNDGKFLRIEQSDFDQKPEGDGREILEAGLQSNMVRRTKSGAYAMVSRQVQQIVSVHDRPSTRQTSHSSVSDEEDMYSQFESLEDEDLSHMQKMKDQPVLAYLGAGLATLALVLGSMISTTGFAGIFIFILALAGFVMTVIGTIQFFKSANDDTTKMSKVLHIVLTVISFFAVLMMAFSAFFAPEPAVPTPNEVSADVAAVKEDKEETETLSLDELKQTVSLSHGAFVAEPDEMGVLRTGLPVSLENTSDVVWTYDIMVQAYNSNGDKVGDPDYILMAKVAPEEPIEYTLFEYITKEEADVLAQEGITFQIDTIDPL